MLRGLFTHALALGWAVSMLVGSTLSARLVLDGAVSFLFVPVFQLLAFAIVYRRASHGLAFDVAAGRFFQTNQPWLLWIFALGVWCVLQSPRDAALWSWPEVLTAVLMMLPVMAWSWRMERALLRPAESVLYRAIAWPLILVYFLGIAVWAEVRWMLAG